MQAAFSIGRIVVMIREDMFVIKEGKDDKNCPKK
jgi:hypothetical protein